MPSRTPRVLFITNFATHYRAKLFEALDSRLDIEFLFFSRGQEGYWQEHLGTTEGSYRAETVVGRRSLPKFSVNIPLVRALRTRDYDVLVKCINGRFELPAAYAIARMRGVPFVLWTGIWMHPRTLAHRLTHPLVRRIYRSADAIVAYGSHVKEFLISEGATPEDVFVAENAVDNAMYSREVSAFERREFRGTWKLGDARVVLTVARLTSQKGLEYLLEAVAGLEEPRPTVVVVGTGPLRGALETLAVELGIDLRIVEGLQPDELVPAYAVADVFVLSSITTTSTKENWGLACNEAMCQGVPVVATDAVGAVAGGLVVDGETGLVVPERSAGALRDALSRLLSDRELAAGLGAHGSERVQRTTHDAMVDGFADAIRRATDRGRSS